MPEGMIVGLDAETPWDGLVGQYQVELVHREIGEQ